MTLGSSPFRRNRDTFGHHDAGFPAFLRIGDRLRTDRCKTAICIDADSFLACRVHVQEQDIVTQATQSKEGRFVNQMADDTGAVAAALDRRIDGQQWDVVSHR